jgi:hypothetical protein
MIGRSAEGRQPRRDWSAPRHAAQARAAVQSRLTVTTDTPRHDQGLIERDRRGLSPAWRRNPCSAARQSESNMNVPYASVVRAAARVLSSASARSAVARAFGHASDELVTL